MSTVRHRAEWLSLLEISDLFLSMPVLTDVFPLGLVTGNAEAEPGSRRPGDRPGLRRRAGRQPAQVAGGVQL